MGGKEAPHYSRKSSNLLTNDCVVEMQAILLRGEICLHMPDFSVMLGAEPKSSVLLGPSNLGYGEFCVGWDLFSGAGACYLVRA